jgi:aminoglycoside phosphotransferase (APT) family kinase protein
MARFAARALEMALVIHRPASQPAPAAAIADDLVADLEWLRRSVPLLPQSVSRRANEAAEVIAVCPKPLPCGRVHGDFSPHNLMIESNARRGATRIIDWEHMEADRPQHLDIFRFIGASLLLGKRGAERGITLQSMQRTAAPFVQDLLRPWLVAMGADAGTWTGPERLEALWWHYWIHATRRSLERQASADPRDSSLLRSLVVSSE